MKGILIGVPGILLVAVLAVQNISAQGKAEERAGDEAAIEKVIATYVETWNRNDMDAWGELFTHETWITSTGAAAGGNRTRKMWKAIG